MVEALETRIEAALAGELDEAGWTALVEELRRDPQARACWWRLSTERAALSQALGEARGQAAHRRPLRLRRLALAAGLLLALGLGALALPTGPAPAAPILAGGDRIEPDAGAQVRPIEDPLTRRWRLESGRIAVSVAREAEGRGFAVETPHLLVEVSGTRFSLTSDPAHSRLEVVEGAVLARAGGEVLMVPAGAWAERGADGWRLAPGLQPLRLLWDAGPTIAGREPLRRGERCTLAGVAACQGSPGAETPQLRTIAIDLPSEPDWRGEEGAVLELRYHLLAGHPASPPPRVALQGWNRGPGNAYQSDLAGDRPGQHRLRLPLGRMQRLGEAANAPLRSLIVTARPEQGLSLLEARILVP